MGERELARQNRTTGESDMLDSNKIQEVVDHANKHDLPYLVDRIKTLDAALRSMAQTKELEEIIIIIIGGGGVFGPPHGNGWTSKAELAFALGHVESAIQLANQVAGMKRALLEWGRLVEPDTGAPAK
jgi:hypothetical protein